MERAAEGLEFEYAALLRDRLERLEALQQELVAFRGRVEGLSFVYRVPGFRGDDRLYLIRKGLVEEELPNPRGKRGKLRAAKKIESVFQAPPVEMGALSQEAASEILLVARWFRLRRKEMARVFETGGMALPASSPHLPDDPEFLLRHRLNGQPGPLEEGHLAEFRHWP